MRSQGCFFPADVGVGCCYSCVALTEPTKEGTWGHWKWGFAEKWKGLPLPKSGTITGGTFGSITGGVKSLFAQSRNFLLFLSLQLLPFLPSTHLTGYCSPGWGMWSCFEGASEPAEPDSSSCTYKKSCVTIDRDSPLPAWFGCLTFVASQRLHVVGENLSSQYSLHLWCWQQNLLSVICNEICYPLKTKRSHKECQQEELWCLINFKWIKYRN